MFGALDILVKHAFKDLEKLPGWVPLFAVTTAVVTLTHVVPPDLKWAGETISTALTAIIVGLLTWGLYTTGDALDDYVFKDAAGNSRKIFSKWYEGAQIAAMEALEMPEGTEGSYAVALALSNAALKGWKKFALHWPNEAAKCLRAFIIPGVLAAPIFGLMGRPCSALLSLVIAVLASVIYPVLKVWHIHVLYAGIPPIVKTTDDRGRKRYHAEPLGDRRLCFWDTVLVANWMMPPKPQASAA
jgi:hypothetical protein